MFVIIYFSTTFVVIEVIYYVLIILKFVIYLLMMIINSYIEIRIIFNKLFFRSTVYEDYFVILSWLTREDILIVIRY